MELVQMIAMKVKIANGIKAFYIKININQTYLKFAHDVPHVDDT